MPDSNAYVRFVCGLVGQIYHRIHKGYWYHWVAHTSPGEIITTKTERSMTAGADFTIVTHYFAQLEDAG